MKSDFTSTFLGLGDDRRQLTLDKFNSDLVRLFYRLFGVSKASQNEAKKEASNRGDKYSAVTLNDAMQYCPNPFPLYDETRVVRFRKSVKLSTASLLGAFEKTQLYADIVKHPDVQLHVFAMGTLRIPWSMSQSAVALAVTTIPIPVETFSDVEDEQESDSVLVAHTKIPKASTYYIGTFPTIITRLADYFSWSPGP